MPAVKTSFFVPCRREECEKITSFLEDLPSTLYVVYEVREDGILVRAYGYPSEIKELKTRLRRLFTQARFQHSAGEIRVEITTLAKMVGGTFPIQPLLLILRRNGFASEYLREDGVLKTNAPMKKLVEVASSLHNAIKGIKTPLKGTSTKYFVATAAVISGIDVEEVVNISVQAGLLKRENDAFSLTVEWTSALDRFLKYVRESMVFGEGIGDQGSQV